MNKLKTLALVASTTIMASPAFAEGEGVDIVGQLVGAVDTSKLLGVVGTLGVVIVSIKFGEKGINFVKRLIGKM